MAKDVRFEVRCTDEEKEMGEQKAAVLGISLGELVRMVFVAPEPPDPSDKDYADIKKALSDDWFMEKVWTKYLSGRLKQACGEYLLTGKLPMPPSNGAGTLKHEEGCDCRRCVPPKEPTKTK